MIKGLNQGLNGLCVGANATLIIPPELGYGGKGGEEKSRHPRIPGGATLNFEVQVMSVAAAPPPPNVFAQADADHDGSLSYREVLEFFHGQDPTDLAKAANRAAQVLKTDDTNGDGDISWDEFSGPKGDAPPPARAAGWNGLADEEDWAPLPLEKQEL